MSHTQSIAKLTQSELDAIKNLEHEMEDKYILIAYQQDNTQQ